MTTDLLFDRAEERSGCTKPVLSAADTTAARIP
jgi:hypothetical protein